MGLQYFKHIKYYSTVTQLTVHYRPRPAGSLCTPLPVWYVQTREDMRVTGGLTIVSSLKY